MALGRQIREILPSGLPDILGGVLLLLFAAWNFYRDQTTVLDQPSARTSSFADRPSVGISESFFLAGTLSINNVGLAIASGIGGISFITALGAIFCFSLALLALGQSIGGNFARVRWLPKVFRYPISGNAVLALAGVLMLAGY
jgi:putative Mn2+ efflux pump MntP